MGRAVWLDYREAGRPTSALPPLVSGGQGKGLGGRGEAELRPGS